MMMNAARWTIGLGTGALIAAATLAAPATDARPGTVSGPPARRAVSFTGIGSFTHASADPRLAALVARSGLSATGFSFTPADSQRGGQRAVTVAVRARSARGAGQVLRTVNTAVSTAPSPVAMAPIAYNLGVAVGWRRFAVTGDLTRLDLGAQPGGAEAASVGVTYAGRRASGRVQATDRRAAGAMPSLVGEERSVSVDVGGSYALTRNFDLTAGLRYKSERDRLPQLTDNRRDSQAVYVGTAFRF